MIILDKAGQVHEVDDSFNIYAPATVINGVWQYASATQLQKADPNTYGGCNRSWFYDYVLGMRGPETEAMRKGRKMLHEPIELFYATGVEAFTPLILPGKRYLYPRESDLRIEREIARRLDEPEYREVLWKGADVKAQTPIYLEHAPLKVAGTAVVGQIDLEQERGYYIDESGEAQREPHKNTVEVNDWKSTSSPDYAKSGPQLMTETIQMPLYGMRTLIVKPYTDWVRLSHTYFLTKGKADAWKSTVLVPAEAIFRRWEYVEGLGRSIVDIARETDPEKVPGNKNSCLAYGRGCAHHPKNGGSCTIARYNSTVSIFGAVGAAILKGEDTTQGVIPIMSLLKKTEGTNQQPLVPMVPQTSTAQPTVVPQNTPSHVGVSLGLGGAPSLADLLAAEAAKQGIAPVEPQPANPSTLPPEVVEAFDVIEASKMGFPVMTGEAANAKVAWTHIKTGTRMTYQPGAALGGSGMLGGLKAHSTIAEVMATANDLRKHAATQQPATPAPQPQPQAPAPMVPTQHITQPLAMLPPDVPTSGQTGPTAAPVEGFSPPGASTQPTATVPTLIVPQNIGTTNVGNQTTEGTLGPKEEPKTEAKPEKPAATRKRTTKPKTEQTEAKGDDSDERSVFELYIDCIPSQPFEMLDPYLQAFNDTIVSHAKLNGFTFVVDDIRVAPKSCDYLAFGAWEATLEAIVREAVADGKLPRARYVLITDGSKVRNIIANAMITARLKNPESGEYTGALVLDNYTRSMKG